MTDLGGPEPYPGHDATGATRGACQADRPCPACRAACADDEFPVWDGPGLPPVELPDVEAWCQQQSDRAGPIIVDAVADRVEQAALVEGLPEGTTLESFIRDIVIESYSQLMAEAMKAELGDFITGTVEEIAAGLAFALHANLPTLTPGDPDVEPDR